MSTVLHAARKKLKLNKVKERRTSPLGFPAAAALDAAAPRREPPSKGLDTRRRPTDAVDGSTSDSLEVLV